MTLRPALLLSLLLFSSFSAPAQTLSDVEQSIVPVTAWGGTPADASLAQRQTITHITLHHQGEPYKAGTDPRQYLRNLQNWSRGTKHWLDIPYHYIIDLDGNIFEGRKIDYAGDTNTEYDPTGHALIEVVGNFEEVEPNQQQLDAVVRLMAMLAQEVRGPPRPHRQPPRFFTADRLPRRQPVPLYAGGILPAQGGAAAGAGTGARAVRTSHHYGCFTPLISRPPWASTNCPGAASSKRSSASTAFEKKVRSFSANSSTFDWPVAWVQ
jgi:hypothetical protein